MRRRVPAAHTRALLLAALLLAACAPEVERELAPREVLHPRATLAIEPAVLRIGDLARAEIWVETPPSFGVRPYRPPQIESLWLLDAEALPVEKESERWRHRIRIRFRPRDVGAHHWPESSVVVEGPDGEETLLAIAAREIEVVSVLPALPERVTPYSWIRPKPRADAAAPWWAAAAGAGAVLLAVACLAGWRRRQAQRPPPATSATDPAPVDLFEWADRELRQAEGRATDAPREAANAGAHIIRSYVASRFGAQTRAVTTQELEALEPPLAMRSRWPYFLRVLRELDDLRFRGQDLDGGTDGTHPRLCSALAEVRRFVEASGLPGRAP